MLVPASAMGKAVSLGNMQTTISTASGAGWWQGAYGYRFSRKIQCCQPWGTTAASMGTSRPRGCFNGLCYLSISRALFQYPLKRNGFPPTPSIFCAEFGIMRLSGEVISTFCWLFFLLSSAAEWVCLILTKTTAHSTFRWGHQKQNGGKRIWDKLYKTVTYE